MYFAHAGHSHHETTLHYSNSGKAYEQTTPNYAGYLGLGAGVAVGTVLVVMALKNRSAKPVKASKSTTAKTASKTTKKTTSKKSSVKKAPSAKKK